MINGKVVEMVIKPEISPPRIGVQSGSRGHLKYLFLIRTPITVNRKPDLILQKSLKGFLGPIINYFSEHLSSPARYTLTIFVPYIIHFFG